MRRLVLLGIRSRFKRGLCGSGPALGHDPPQMMTMLGGEFWADAGAAANVTSKLPRTSRNVDVRFMVYLLFLIEVCPFGCRPAQPRGRARKSLSHHPQRPATSLANSIRGAEGRLSTRMDPSWRKQYPIPAIPPSALSFYLAGRTSVSLVGWDEALLTSSLLLLSFQVTSVPIESRPSPLPSLSKFSRIMVTSQSPA